MAYKYDVHCTFYKEISNSLIRIFNNYFLLKFVSFYKPETLPKWLIGNFNALPSGIFE